eukprot:s860_g27.t1
MTKKGAKVVAKKPVEVPSQCDTSHLEYTAMCSFYAIGKCLRGENCKFAHSALQIRQKPDLTRTSLCHDFMRKRSCKNGDKCRYAHGEKELQLRPGRASTSSPASPASPSQISDPADPDPLTWDPIGLSMEAIGSPSTSATSATCMFPLMQKLMMKRQQKRQASQGEMVGSKMGNAMSAMGRFSISPDLAWPKSSINSLEALTQVKTWKGLAPFPSNLSSFLDPWKVVMHNGRIGCALDSAPETLEFPMHINTDFVRCHSEPAKSWA